MILPITDNDYMFAYGKTRSELMAEFNDIYQAGADPRVDSFKRLAWEKYVPEVTWENLYKYYMSPEFCHMLIRTTSGNLGVYEKKYNDGRIYDWIYDLERIYPISKYPKVKILIYGTGANMDYVYPIAKGYDITLADIPHKQFQLIKKVMRRYFTDKVSFIDLVADDQDLGQFDVIISTEVLEHVLEPEEVVENFHYSLKKHGWMYLSVFMDDMNGQDPSHLAKNTERYNDPETWHEVVNSKGFIPALYKKDTTLKWWLKV